MRKKAIIAVVLVIVALTVYFLGQQYWWGTKFVPPEFIEARSQGAFIAEKIVFLAHQSLAGLEQAGHFDKQKNYAAALNKINVELERNDQARREAILLSSYLGTMAAYLSQIEPVRARSLATEAVGYEISLVNRLINFHGLLNQLLELLQKKFMGKIENSEARVEELIAFINGEIRAINNLNLKFGSTMEQFDTVFE